MSSLFIVLESEIPGLDHYVNGHAMAKADRKLSKIAKGLGAVPLMEFFSTEPDEISEFTDDLGVETENVSTKQSVWFPSSSGLETVNALLTHLEKNPDVIKKSDQIVSELKQWKTVLSSAVRNGKRWHLAVDY